MGGDDGVMAGGGYYAHHSSTQGGAAERGVHELRAALADVALTDPAVRVADLGCAQGHNSLAPVSAAIGAVRDRDPDRPVEVVHTDLPGNDWATFFTVLGTDPGSYLHDGHEVYASVVGRSFYERLFAPSTVTVAWTSSTLHWLSRAPGPVADHFFVQSSSDGAARARYRAQAERDWRSFLSHRAVELVVGGAVVFVDVLMGDDGTMGSEALFDRLQAAIAAARDAGRIDDDEVGALTYPTWFRTTDELQAPFLPTGFDGPSGSRLELTTLEPTVLEDPFLDDLRRTGDVTAYGRAQAGFLEGFLRPSFRSALHARPAREADRILDDLFADTATRIARDAAQVSPRYRLVVGRITRIRPAPTAPRGPIPTAG